MNLDRQAFTAAVAFAARALPRSNAIPTLTGLRVTATKGRVIVSAFDFDTYADADAGPCPDDFDVLLPGRALAAYLNGMSATTLTLTVGERQADLTGGSARVTLPTLSLADYPSAPAVPASVGTVDADAFAEALGYVRDSVDPNETLHALRGVVLDLRGPLVVAGVHRHRCAVRTVEGWEGGGDHHVIAPVALVDAAKAMTGPLTIGADGRIALCDGVRTVVVRQLDAEPNPYMRLFDAHTSDLTVTCDRVELIDALKWVSAGDTRKEAVGILVMTIGESITLALSGAEAMTATTEVEAKVDGEELTIGWKAENLLKGLGATSAATVTLACAGPMKPTLITAETDPGFRYLGMPVKLATAR